MRTSNKSILNNIIKIRNDRGFKQATVAEGIFVDYSTYSKIESGQIKLSTERLEELANFFDMDIIDIITYPNKYVSLSEAPESIKKSHTPKVLVQIEVDEDKKEQILKMVLGEENHTLLNK